MALNGAIGWFAKCNCVTSMSWSDSLFRLSSIYCNQNRLALLLKLMTDNSLMAVSSVNYFAMIIAIADL